MSLIELIAEYGSNNLYFQIPMRRLEMIGLIPGIAIKSSTTPEDSVLCRIDESRYKLLDNYKITLRATEEIYGREHFYISDLESLLRRNSETFKLFVETIDGFTQLYID
jgi:hypothetical protein